MPDRQVLARDFHHHPGKPIGRDHFLGSDSDGSAKSGKHQSFDAFQTFIDKQKGPCLLSVSPDIDFTPIRSFGHLAAYGRQ